MAKYKVEYLDRSAKNIKKIVSAKSDDDLRHLIKDEGGYLVDYTLVKEDKVVFRKPKTKNLIIFCRQSAIMLQSGITMIKALDILENKTDSKGMKRIYASVNENMQKGNSLSRSMKDEGVFDDLLLSMVESGELGGILEVNLQKMADYYEKEHKLHNKVKSAMMYPIILAIVATAVVLLLVTMVLPTFVAMYKDQTQLPLPTVIVMGISSFIINYWMFLLIGLVALVVAIRQVSKIADVRYRLDKLKLSLPIFGKLNRTIYSSRCARSFSSLYASGVSMMEILVMVSKVMGNMYIQDSFKTVIQGVSKGEYISTSLQRINVFDPMFTSMVYIGEESGAMDRILNKAADYFDEEADAATQKMVSLLEPILIIVMGFVVGFIVIAIMLPMYGMLSQIG